MGFSWPALPFCFSPRLSSFLLLLRAVGTRLGLAKQFSSSQPCSLAPENGNGDCAVVLAELWGRGGSSWNESPTIVLEFQKASNESTSVPESFLMTDVLLPALKAEFPD